MALDWHIDLSFTRIPNYHILLIKNVKMIPSFAVGDYGIAK